MTPAEALQMLATRPLEFLQKNSFTPHAVVGKIGAQTFYMADKGGEIKRVGTIRSGNLYSGQRFVAYASATEGAIPFHAIHIPVQPSNVAINAYPLHTAGTNLMLTTQLTGCSIVMIPDSGSYKVAHLQPTGETGDALRNRLKGLKYKVYGITDYTGFRAVVVGVRQGGTWNFYAQTQDPQFNVTGAKQLKS